MKVDIFVFFLVLEKYFQLFIVEYDISFRLVTFSPIMLRCFPTLPTLLRVFNINEC